MRRDLHFSPSLYQVGLGVGLVSLSAFFIGLILAFAFRIETQPGKIQFHAPTSLWLSTVLLAVSSWLLEAARYALRRALIAIYRGRVLAAMILGFVFLALQVSAGLNLFEQGVMTVANPQGSAFYIFMGVHGAHILGGLGWLLFLFIRSAALFSGSENDLRKHRLIAGAAASYWHYMGLVWAVLFFFLLQWSR
ncbi:MAG TPA: cytochrome c oxidase subunit 3 [Bryobacteraceae bacterium]|nr:cytochrome c oxidase subunit 3 [Bryobacteraceae bacterium]